MTFVVLLAATAAVAATQVWVLSGRPRPAVELGPAGLRPWAAPALAAAAWGAVALPVYLHLKDPATLVMGGNDQSAHIGWALDVELWPPSFPQPQLLFQLLVRLVMVPTSWSATSAGVAVLVGLTAWSGWAAQRYCASVGTVVGPVVATLASLVLLMSETPWVLLRQTATMGAGDAALGLHLWATPSNTFLLPFALLLAAATLRIVARPTAAGAVGLAALSVVAMLGKPNAPLVIIPAAILLAILLPAGRRALPHLVVGGLVPIVAVGLVQVRILESTTTVERSSLRIAPGLQWGIAGADRPLFWVIAVPLAAMAAVCWTTVRTDRAVHLATLATVVGAVQLGLLGETGLRADHANWALSLHVAFSVLWLSVVRHALGALVARTGSVGSRVALAAALGVGLVAGVGAWVVAADLVRT